jgi:predicted RNA-binding protein with RPS1 domain
MSVFELDTSRINIGSGVLGSASSMTFKQIHNIISNAVMQKTKAEICFAVMELDLDKSVSLSVLTSKENAGKKKETVFLSRDRPSHAWERKGNWYEPIRSSRSKWSKHRHERGPAHMEFRA